MSFHVAARITINIVIKKASTDFTPIAHRTIQITSPAIVVKNNSIGAGI